MNPKWALVCWEPITRQATALSVPEVRPHSTLTKSGSGGTSLEYYTKDAIDGAWVVDKTSLDYGTIAHMVYCGPMATTRNDGRMLPSPLFDTAKRNVYDLVSVLREHGISSIDYVDPWAYAALYRHLGARIGRVYRGIIEWERT